MEEARRTASLRQVEIEELRRQIDQAKADVGKLQDVGADRARRVDLERQVGDQHDRLTTLEGGPAPVPASTATKPTAPIRQVLAPSKTARDRYLKELPKYDQSKPADVAALAALKEGILAQ